jgi:hypothetical protein
LGGLITICGSLVGRVLLALGMGYVTFKGFDLTVSWLLTQIKANFAGMPADVVSFLGWLWVDKAIGMIFSAYSVAMVAKLAGNTNVTKLVTKG